MKFLIDYSHNNTIWTAPLLEKANYSMAQLVPVVLASRALNILVVHPSLPVHSIKDLIALAKSKPGDINSGVEAVGSTPQEFANAVNADTARMQKVIQAAGLRAE